MKTLEESLTPILAKDRRFAVAAYLFMYESLDYTVKRIGARRHVSGRELLEGIRNLALDQFGPLAVAVFERWGVRSCEDFGAIVFNLVNAGLMGKTETDTIDDFRNGYDFRSAFAFDEAAKRAKSKNGTGKGK